VDPVPGNNSDTDTNPTGAQSDLTISKSSSPDPYVPGSAFTYTIVVSNAGPSNAVNARVQDALPAPLSGFAWTCAASGTGASCGTSAGAGDIDAFVSLPVGTSATFTVTGTVPPGTTGVLVNTATVAPPSGVVDPVPGNNSDTDTNPTGAQADLSISKSSSPDPYVPGAAFTYTIVVNNAGPSNAVNATVQDVLPAPLSGFAWTCAASGSGASCGTSAGTGDIDALVSLPVGTSATFTVSGTVPSGATGALVNTATVTPPLGVVDPALGNNSDTDTNPSGPQADLSITKTDGVDSVIAGEATTYTITVKNNGPSEVTNATVVDNAPSGLTIGNWSCSVTNAGSAGSVTTACGAAGGSGNINTTVTMRSGAIITYTVPATVSWNATGNIANTATVAPPAGVVDPVPGNNSATDTDAITPLADLSISKSSTPDPYVPGAPFTYTIVVSNAGPSNAVNARVQDVLPAPLSGFAWTCVASGTGASCGTSAGAGDIDALVSLPVGTFAIFTVSGTVPSGATGELVNTATVAAPSGVVDPVPGNNSATETNPTGAQSDLTISKSSSPDPYVPGSAFTYTVVVSNAGPSNAVNARVQDALPAPLSGFAWTCVPSGIGASCGTAAGADDIDAFVSLPVGTSATFRVSGTVPSGTTGELVNTATVSPPPGVTDPVPGNNSDSDANPSGPQADLAITKTDGVDSVVAGTSTIYTITVRNNGPSEVTNARVVDNAPTDLTIGSWTCAVTNSGGAGSVTTACGAAKGSGNINTTVTMRSGAIITFTVPATVSSTATGTIANTATVSPPAGVVDPDPANNSSTDTDIILGPVVIPTLNEWGLFFFALLLFVIGVITAGRRSRTYSP
jgi:uncharacterized repeat protein (TIGR01451 family)